MAAAIRHTYIWRYDLLSISKLASLGDAITACRTDGVAEVGAAGAGMSITGSIRSTEDDASEYGLIALSIQSPRRGRRSMHPQYGGEAASA